MKKILQCILFLATVTSFAQVAVTTISSEIKGSGGLSLDGNGNLIIADFGDFLSVIDPDGQPNDVHIMDKALEYKFRRPGDLRDVNHCRLYCGVITLADACTADGRRLAKEVYTCARRNFRSSRLLWPRLPKPTKRQMNIWRAFLAQTFLVKMPSAIQTKGRATPNRLDLQLAEYLGRWTAHPATRQCFAILIGNNRRFLWNGSGYREENSSEVLSPEDLPYPVYAVERYDGRTKNDARWPKIDRSGVNWLSLRWSPDPKPPPNNFLSRREDWMEDLVWNVRLDCEDLHSALEDTVTIRCGSDGGADDGKASFG